jgi:hypothetical protein
MATKKAARGAASQANVARILGEIAVVLRRYDDVRKYAKSETLQEASALEVTTFVSLAAACADRVAPPGSTHKTQIRNLSKRAMVMNPKDYVVPLVGLLRALREDYETGRIKPAAK